MKSNTFIKIKRPTKPTPQTQYLPQADEQLEVEPTQPLEIEQSEQPAPTVPLKSLTETP
jgi:hypothetical protein